MKQLIEVIKNEIEGHEKINLIRNQDKKQMTEWHYVTDKLPPNPKESEDGKSCFPLNYICAYDCGDGDYECDDFMYLGDGVWNGENKDYPIYAWMDCAVEVPLPPRKENEQNEIIQNRIR